MVDNKIRAFLDTNVLIDLLDEERPGAEDASVIFHAAKCGLIEIFLTTQSFIDAEYVASRAPGLDREKLFNSMLKLMGYVNIGHIYWTDVRNAILNFTGDFEDDAQFSNASFEGCDVIITSDKKFLSRPATDGPTMLTPAQFVAKIS
ncbi:MAG: PIN domain-containing protein [Bacteroidales bacterium]|nr:PIN domain-containing protein [Bacteroidales bacterium]